VSIGQLSEAAIRVRCPSLSGFSCFPCSLTISASSARFEQINVRRYVNYTRSRSENCKGRAVFFRINWTALKRHGRCDCSRSLEEIVPVGEKWAHVMPNAPGAAKFSNRRQTAPRPGRKPARPKPPQSLPARPSNPAQNTPKMRQKTCQKTLKNTLFHRLLPLFADLQAFICPFSVRPQADFYSNW
jgi:hypothetical protein